MTSGIYDDDDSDYYTGSGLEDKIIFDPNIYTSSGSGLYGGSDNWLLDKARSARDSVKEKALYAKDRVKEKASEMKDRLKALRARGYGMTRGGKVYRLGYPDGYSWTRPRSGAAKPALGYRLGGAKPALGYRLGGAKRAWGYSSSRGGRRGGSTKSTSSLFPRYGTRGYHGYGFPTYGGGSYDDIYGGSAFTDALKNVGKNALTGVLQGFLR